VTSIEVDNFFTDRDHREEKGINSEGKEALHLELFKGCLDDLRNGRKTSTPRYNFLDGSSSHDLKGNLKPGRTPVEVEPGDVIFMEGNFPFLIEEIIPLIQIKVVYLTDDPVRLKRKWRRDMDLRKKYEYHYFLNRYFSEQFIMAQRIYIPQMESADMIIDTTGAAVWMVPAMVSLLDDGSASRRSSR
jgi:uridine kinase